MEELLLFWKGLPLDVDHGYRYLLPVRNKSMSKVKP